MSADFLKILHDVVIFMVPFLFSLCFHEYAHGWMAKRRGDRTAELMGRLTMNPMAHADLVGTVILPILGIATGAPIFGWANPVPVNERNLKNPRKDMFWVAAAGPVSNLLLATIVMFIFTILLDQMTLGEGMSRLLAQVIQLNLVLAFFNLIPLHPLDGGKILARFIPVSWDRKLEENQQMTSWGLLLLMILGVLPYIVIPPVQFTYRLLGELAERIVLFF